MYSASLAKHINCLSHGDEFLFILFHFQRFRTSTLTTALLRIIYHSFFVLVCKSMLCKCSHIESLNTNVSNIMIICSLSTNVLRMMLTQVESMHGQCEQKRACRRFGVRRFDCFLPKWTSTRTYSTLWGALQKSRNLINNVGNNG